jgi:hypothetical protein
MTASLSPADIPPAADAAAFQPRSRVGVVATGASSAPPAPRTATGLAFGDAPASVPAPAAPVVAAPSLSGTTIPAHQLSETTEVQQARVAAQLAEARLYGAIMAGGASDAELKKLQLEVVSSKLALAEASGEPADRVENLSDKVVVAKVFLAAATANENDVVAFIRGNHLFMNNIEVDYVRKLSPSDQNEITRQCGAHVKSMSIKPGEIVARPSAPGIYREFIDKYPELRPKPVDKPRLVDATPKNLATIELIRKRESSEIRYMSDMDQWGNRRTSASALIHGGLSAGLRLPDDGTERDSRADPSQSHAGDPDNARGMRRLDARAVGRSEIVAASVAGCRPGDCCAGCRQGGPRGRDMIRWLIDFRFAVHYGLNSDIELRRKSATSDIAILT